MNSGLSIQSTLHFSLHVIHRCTMSRLFRNEALKLVSAIFYQTFFSSNDRPSKTIKMFFISSKKLFSFLRYSDFCDFFPSFPHFPDSKGQMEEE